MTDGSIGNGIGHLFGSVRIGEMQLSLVVVSLHDRAGSNFQSTVIIRTGRRFLFGGNFFRSLTFGSLGLGKFRFFFGGFSRC